MEVLESVLKEILMKPVFLTVISVYLNINKTWPRKHEITVAQSTSVISKVISSFITLIFFMYYLLYGDIEVALDNFFWLLMNIFLFLVSISFWVKDSKHQGIWQKFTRSLKQEASESTNLIKALNQPSGKRELLNILYRIVWLDDELDEKEQQYIQMFADTWGIDPSHLFAEPPPEKGMEKLNKVREQVIDYLALHPSKEQALSLSDVIQVLIRIDEHITKEEELIGAEISGMLASYGSQPQEALHGVMIHPNEEQQAGFLALVPNAKEEYLLGGNYREQNFFTVVHKYNP
jgi:hypothetical protein